MKPPRNNRLSRREVAIIVEPIRAGLLKLRSGEIETVRGYPAFIDWKGEWSRIDHALHGWVDCWRRFATDIDLGPQDRLRRRISAGVPLMIAEIDAALSTLKQQEAALVRLPRDFVQAQTTTELIKIEFEERGLAEVST